MQVILDSEADGLSVPSRIEALSGDQGLLSYYFRC